MEHSTKHLAKVVCGVEPGEDGQDTMMIKVNCQVCGEFNVGPFPIEHLPTLYQVIQDMSKRLGVDDRINDKQLTFVKDGYVEPEDSLEEVMRKHALGELDELAKVPKETREKLWRDAE